MSRWYIKASPHESFQYLDIFPQYHSALDGWLSSDLESHAAITLVVLFLGWSSDHKHRITNTKIQKLWKKLSYFLNQKARLPSIIWGFIIINVIILEPKICYTLNKENKAGEYLLPWRCWFLRQETRHHDQQGRKGPAGTPSECKTEPRCRFGSSQAPRTLQHQLHSDSVLTMWLSALCGCKTPAAGPLKKTPEGDIVLLLRLAPCGRLCTD